MSQVRWERAHNGCVIGWIQREPDRVVLRRFADVVTESFGAESKDRVDGGDMVFWDFEAGVTRFTLHLDRAQGIGLLAGDQSAASEQLVVRIAEHLASTLV